MTIQYTLSSYTTPDSKTLRRLFPIQMFFRCFKKRKGGNERLLTSTAFVFSLAFFSRRRRRRRKSLEISCWRRHRTSKDKKKKMKQQKQKRCKEEDLFLCSKVRCPFAITAPHVALTAASKQTWYEVLLSGDPGETEASCTLASGREGGLVGWCYVLQ